MKLHKISALAAVSILAFAACSTPGASSSGPSSGAAGSAAASVAAPTKGELKLGVTLPLSGSAAADGQPTLKGAQLAADQANAAGGIGGYSIKVVPLDHAVNGQYNEQQGAADMQDLRRRPEGHRRRRPVQLGRREGPDPDQQRGGPAPVQPGQHATRR